MPGPLHQTVLPASHSVGAGVSTHSWGHGGTRLGEYNKYSGDVDQFMHEHPKHLSIWAAGNNAEDACGPHKPHCDLFTVQAPSNAKNALSVGATQNALESWKHYKLQDFTLRAGNASLIVVSSSFSPVPKEVILVFCAVCPSCPPPHLPPASAQSRDQGNVHPGLTANSCPAWAFVHEPRPIRNSVAVCLSKDHKHLASHHV